LTEIQATVSSMTRFQSFRNSLFHMWCYWVERHVFPFVATIGMQGGLSLGFHTLWQLHCKRRHQDVVLMPPSPQQGTQFRPPSHVLQALHPWSCRPSVISLVLLCLTLHTKTKNTIQKLHLVLLHFHSKKIRIPEDRNILLMDNAQEGSSDSEGRKIQNESTYFLPSSSSSFLVRLGICDADTLL